MQKFFQKITPVFIVSLVGIIYLIAQIFIIGLDYNILAYILIFIILISFAFAIDRLLSTKIAYKKLFVFELLFLIICLFWYLYSSSYTMINIETSKPYFLVVYDNNGLKKNDIPTEGVFNKSITITSDTTVHISKSLEYDAQINPPKAWKYSYSSFKKEARVNGENVVIEIFAHEMQESVLKEKLLDAEVAKMQQSVH